MKKVLLVLLLTSIGFAQKPAIKNVKFDTISKSLLNGYDVQKDDFKNAVFIKKGWDYLQDFRLYLALKDDVVRLRFVTIYKKSGWVFYNKVIFLIDGESYTLDADNTSRTVLSGSLVEEKADFLVNENLFKIINLILTTDSDIKVRFEGDQYHSDTKITKRDRKLMRDIMNLYEKL